jgi:hypothetical protein
MAHSVPLTPAEIEVVAWALDPQGDYFSDLVNEGSLDAMPELPTLRGNTLTLPDVAGIAASDLHYRCCVQLLDMEDGFIRQEVGAGKDGNAARARHRKLVNQLDTKLRGIGVIPEDRRRDA